MKYIWNIVTNKHSLGIVNPQNTSPYFYLQNTVTIETGNWTRTYLPQPTFRLWSAAGSNKIPFLCKFPRSWSACEENSMQVENRNMLIKMGKEKGNVFHTRTTRAWVNSEIRYYEGSGKGVHVGYVINQICCSLIRYGRIFRLNCVSWRSKHCLVSSSLICLLFPRRYQFGGCVMNRYILRLGIKVVYLVPWLM